VEEIIMSRRPTNIPSTKRVAADDYLELVKQHPLRPIRSRAEFLAAGEVLDAMVGREDLSGGQRDYLDALVHFVTEYERQTTRAKLRKLSPIDVLKTLMQANRMNTSDLGAVLGARGLASEVLNGKRGLSKTLIMKLARHFAVGPDLFLDAA
jgi:HTH-type transcriptional regulator / antitoxin HigA